MEERSQMENEAKERDSQSEMEIENEAQSASDHPNPPELQVNVKLENVRLPLFWNEQPQFWFKLAEDEFKDNDIDSNAGKCYIVLKHLDADTRDNINPLLEELPESHKYEYLETLLIKMCSDSSEKEFAVLLKDIELGDKTPTALLWQMRSAVAFRADDELLRKFWLQRLPINLLKQLVPLQEGITLDKLAAFADTMIRVMVAVESTSCTYAKTIATTEEEVNDVADLLNKSLVSFESMSWQYANSIAKVTQVVNDLLDVVNQSVASVDSASSTYVATINKLIKNVRRMMVTVDKVIAASEAAFSGDAEKFEALLAQRKKLTDEVESIVLGNDLTSTKNAEIIKELQDNMDVFQSGLNKRRKISDENSQSTFDIVQHLSNEVTILKARLVEDTQKTIEKENKRVITWLRRDLFKSKIELKRFITDKHFEHTFLDIIGPLPSCRGYEFCLVMEDKNTAWLEATPIPDTSAETVARAFVTTWISRFGSPKFITTTPEPQFQTKLFSQLLKLLGCKMEPNHELPFMFDKILPKQLKNNGDWLTALPLILLGMRAAFRPHLQRSSTAKVYLRGVTLPNAFIHEFDEPDESVPYIQDLTRIFSEIRPQVITAHTLPAPFIYDKLENATHVLVKEDSTDDSLPESFRGPYYILARLNSQTYRISMDKKPYDYPIDSLRPAFRMSRKSMYH